MMPIVLPADLRDLETAEEFLDHFAIPYDAKDASRVAAPYPAALSRLSDAGGRYQVKERLLPTAMRALMLRAYEDFVRSDPLTERVFKVLKEAHNKPAAPAGRVFVPLSGSRWRASPRRVIYPRQTRGRASSARRRRLPPHENED